METSYNPTMDESAHIMTEDEVTCTMTQDEMAIKNEIYTKTEFEPKTFEEAWFHADLETRKKWREAIKKEICCMLGKDVWDNMTHKVIQQLNVKSRRKSLIGCRWVFKIKRNGTFRARLVAQGYTQVKGIDYDENYSPVVKDICHRLIMAKMISNEHWKKTITDVETAFLYGKLDKVLFM